MWPDQRTRRAGLAALAGGLLALAVTPLMVMVKYSTGWNIIPRPAWEGIVRPALEPLVSFATPVQLWIVYGFTYSVALALMVVGLVALDARSRPAAGWIFKGSLRILLASLSLVIVGDALHTATWHLGGATVPRPGLHPVASLGISLSYLGLPLVFISSFVVGLASWRHRLVPGSVAGLLLAVGPGGALLTATQLPAMPSGALFIFSVAMIVLGHSLAGRRPTASAMAGREPHGRAGRRVE